MSLDKKKKSNNKSNRHERKLVIRDTNLFKSQHKNNKEKKLVANNTKKTNLYNQITSITNGDEATQKFKLSICRKKKSGKSVSNNIAEQMDIDYPQATGIQFKEEIIIEILSKLPMRSILRFKCVLKSWNALIPDPYFIMKHLNHAKNDQNSQKLLINKKCLDKDDMFNLYCSSLTSAQVIEDEQKLDWPSNCKPVNSVLYCCCDGLVLLAVFNGLDRRLLLWNPSTGESIVLPHPNTRPRYCVCGMGYDAIIDDYKILAVDLHETCQEVSVEILTLKSGSWKKNCEYPAGIRRVLGVKDCGMYSLAFVHGAFHWVGLSRCYTIVSFDISNEVYGEIPLLQQMCNIYKAKFTEHGVAVLGGMLCFHSTYYKPWGGMFKLWVMKEYGVKESWTELLTIQSHGSNFFYSAKPIYMYADGEVLLRCNYFGVLGSVYRTSREPFELLPQCTDAFKQGMVYTESLISPKSLI